MMPKVCLRVIPAEERGAGDIDQFSFTDYIDSYLVEGYSSEKGINSRAFPTSQSSLLPDTQAEPSSVLLGKP